MKIIQKTATSWTTIFTLVLVAAPFETVKGQVDPVAGSNEISTSQGSPAVVDVDQILLSCTSQIGLPLSITAVTSPTANGATVTLANGQITYSPLPGFTGPDTVDYTLSDGLGTAEGTITVVVTPSNPSALIYQVSTPISGSLSMGMWDVYGSPQNGGAQPGICGSVAVNFTTLTETVYLDPVAGTIQQVGFISVSPSAANNSISISENQQIPAQFPNPPQTVSGDLSVTLNLVDNGIYFDTGPQPVTWDTLNQVYTFGADLTNTIPFSGSYSLATGGQTYTGNFNFALENPVGWLHSFAFSEVSVANYPASVFLSGLGNDGGPAEYMPPQSVAAPTIIADVVAANGFHLQLAPGTELGGGWRGYWFTWGSAPVTVTLASPPPLNSAPQVQCPANISTTTAPGQSQQIVSFAATVTAGSPAPVVTYQLNGSPITSPYAFPVGKSTVNVTANNIAGSTTCSFTVTVAESDLPIAGSNEISTSQGSPAVADIAQILLSCTSPSGLPLSITAATSPTANGATVTLANGQITYSPLPGFTGLDTVDYTLSDGLGAAEGTITVVVTPANHSALIYQFSTPINGSLTMGMWDIYGSPQDGGSQPGISGSVVVNFTTLTETVYLDRVAGTIQQVGFISVSPSAANNLISIGENQQIPAQFPNSPQSVSGDLTVTLNLVDNGIYFDTGPQPVTWDTLNQVYTFGADLTNTIPFSGSYSLATGGQTYTGSFSFALENPVGWLHSFAFSEVSVANYPASVFLSGLGGPGAEYMPPESIAANAGNPPPTIIADVVAANGFHLQLAPGTHLYGGWGGYWFTWGSAPVTVTLASPPSLNCPEDISTIAAPGQSQQIVSFAATATAGSPTPVVSYQLNGTPITSPYAFPVGKSTVKVTANNVAGSATCSFTVTVVQNPLPIGVAQVTALNLPQMTLLGAASDSLNNTYVLGLFTGTLNIGGQSLVSLGGSDYVLAQYLPDGTLGWAINFGTPQDENASYTSLSVMSSGVFVTGVTEGSMQIVDTAGNTVHTAYVAGGDGFLFCFSFAGVALWQASVTGISAGDTGRAVTSDADGNIYWVGDFNGCCPSQGSATLTGGDGGAVTLTTPSYNTAFLAKMTAAGKVLWTATAYNRDTEFDYVTVDSLGGVYVAGYSRSWSSGTPTTVVSADGTTSSVSNPGLVSHPLVKFNSAGIVQWSVSIYGTPGGDVNTDYAALYALSSVSGNDIAIAGDYSSSTLTLSSTDGANQQLSGGGGYDGFVARYGADGTAKWVVEVGGPSDQSVSAIGAGTSGLWVGGTTSGGISMPGTTLTGLGGQDAFVLQMDDSGDVLYGTLLGGPNNDTLSSLQVSGNSLDLVAGNEGGSFDAFGLQIANAGPFVLIASPAPIAPQIQCPADISTTTAPGQSQQIVSFAATVTAGSPTPVVTYQLNGSPITSPYAFPVGKSTVNVTANNVAGSATCSFTVTVVQNPLPIGVGKVAAINVPQMLLLGAGRDALNNTYVLGLFSGTLSIGGQSLASLGGSDYVLAKYLPDGTVGWAIDFGTPEDEYYSKTTLTVTPSGLFVTGTTQGSVEIVDTAGNTVHTAYVGGGDGFLFYFSFAGVGLWQASITGPSNEDGRAVALDAEGNVYWVGDFNGCCPSSFHATLMGGDGGAVTLTTPSYNTAFLAKMTAGGKVLWTATAYNRDTEFDYVTVDSLGGVYVAGYCRSWSSGTPTTVVNADGTTSSVSNPGLVSHPLVKFNSAGIVQWSDSIYGTPGGDVNTDYADVYGLCSVSGNDIVIAGDYSSSTLTLSSRSGGNQQMTGGVGYDGFVARYGADGTAKWGVEVGGPSDQSVSAIGAGTSGLWVGGTTSGGISMPGITLTGLGGQDAFVLQMDGSGDVLYGTLLGGPNNDTLSSLQVSGNSLDLVAGNEGGGFAGLGVTIANAGPFVLTAAPCGSQVPIAGSNEMGTSQGSPAVVDVAKMLLSCTSPSGLALSITAVTSPTANGATVTLANGQITYSPLPGFIGQDTLSYTLSDGCGTAQGAIVVLVMSATLPSMNRVSLSVDPITGDRTIVFAGVPGATYVVQSSTTSCLGPWTDSSGPLVAAGNGLVQYTDLTSPSPPLLFYRTRWVSGP